MSRKKSQLGLKKDEKKSCFFCGFCYNTAMKEREIKIGSMVTIGIASYVVEDIERLTNMIWVTDNDGGEHEFHISRVDAVTYTP